MKRLARRRGMHSVPPLSKALPEIVKRLYSALPGSFIVTAALHTCDRRSSQSLRACPFLAATEDEELTVSFWNGKKSTVPLRVAIWISPSVHYRIVDTLHRPISSRLSYRDTADRSATYSSAVAVPMCSADHAHKYRCHCHSIHSHLPTCCQDWWPLSPRTTVYIRGKKDVDEELLNPTMKTRARRCKQRDRRSSSSSEAEGEESLDDESDDETCLSKTTQTTMVDSAVNTDSSLWGKQRLDTSDRPDWKYWKRNQPEPFYRKPGTDCDARSAERTGSPAL
ncbi:hypothetical protein GDO78_018322 [Eleutherodactylus coqui]|uniref:Uncharacterized protein n=1 Tax=Eleutherodactylus coqui TaxID=57060 RepID=A0A8J6E9Q7_ELECQ|nr:hypothetical protein GDO78_018322 [Eleutherodactylus coqui]